MRAILFILGERQRCGTATSESQCRNGGETVKPPQDNFDREAGGGCPPPSCSVFLLDSMRGMELAVRLLSACSDLGALLDLIEKCPQRRLIPECSHDSVYRPDKGNDGEENKERLPSICGQDGVFEAGGAKCRHKSDEQRDRSDPSLLGVNALKVIAEAEMEAVFGNDDEILVKIKMNRSLLEIIRREGFGELSLWRNDNITHCSLLSASRSSSLHPSTLKLQPHES